MFNRGKLLSGVAAVGIYLLFIFIILYYYNIHNQKAKNYVEKNSNRVTVTLVNSDKTVLNRSDKVNTPSKPIPNIKTHTPLASISQAIPKKAAIKPPKSKKIKQSQEQVRQKEIAAKREAKQRRLARIEAEKKKKKEAIERKKKEQERQRLAAQEAKKRKEAKRRKEQERQRLAALEAKKKKEAKERRRREEEKKHRQSQDLFANVNIKEPVKRQRQNSSQPNRVKHTSTATDRIKNTHQSGQVSNKNRERGVENAYIAKVKRQLSNWSAQSNYKGHRATIRLTINSSGHFRYSIQSSTSASMSSGLRDFLEQLNRMGLGSHNRSTPYDIKVHFIAR